MLRPSGVTKPPPPQPTCPHEHGVEQSPPNPPALPPEWLLPVPVREALGRLVILGRAAGCWWHLPSCPRAVAARLSSSSSPRGCGDLGIAGLRRGPILQRAWHRSLHPGPRGGFYWAQEDKCHRVPWQRGALNPRVVAPPPRCATSTRRDPRTQRYGNSTPGTGETGRTGSSWGGAPKQRGSSAVLGGKEADLGLFGVVWEERLHAAGAGFARWVQTDGRTEGRVGGGLDGRTGGWGGGLDGRTEGWGASLPAAPHVPGACWVP